MRLQRNQQRTTTHQSSFRNKKIWQSRNHNRRTKRQRHRLGTARPKNESLLRLRRNRQKRSNPAPRRPQRPSTRIPHARNGLSKRKHRSHITLRQSSLLRSQQTPMGILRNIREVVGNLKHDRPTPKLCPRCGNPKLGLSSRFDIWLFPEQYVCEQCGYKGPITLELEKEKANDDVQA